MLPKARLEREPPSASTSPRRCDVEKARLVSDTDHAPLAGGSETVLVVDDEESIRDLAKRFLTRGGYKVLLASNGQKALEVYAREEKEDISLVVLDLAMAVMGGKECLKRLLKIDPRVRTLIASGHATDDTKRECVELGAKGFVAKPFKFDKLMGVVRTILDET